MNSRKRKTSSIAITFYVFAVFMLLVLIYSGYMTYTSVKETMETYSYTYADQWQGVLSTYISQCLMPLFAAVVCYGLGTIINKQQEIQDVLTVCLEDAVEEKLYKKEKKIKNAKKAVSENDDDVLDSAEEHK